MGQRGFAIGLKFQVSKFNFKGGKNFNLCFSHKRIDGVDAMDSRERRS
jgi:hypothetical protein